VSNGLFGGVDLKEEEGVKGQGKQKLNSIFDYEDSDEEKKTPAGGMFGQASKDVEDKKKANLFKIDEDDDDDGYAFKPPGQQ